MKFLFILFAGAILVSCNNDQKDDEDKKTDDLQSGVDKIEFISRGPTVAPVYNRGYVLTFTPDSLLIEIKSYNDILKSEKRSFSAEQFNSLRSKLEGLEPEKRDDNPPVGGGSTSIILYKDGKELVQRSEYGSQFRDGHGNVLDITKWVPDINALVDQTRENDQ